MVSLQRGDTFKSSAKFNKGNKSAIAKTVKGTGELLRFSFRFENGKNCGTIEIMDTFVPSAYRVVSFSWYACVYWVCTPSGDQKCI